MEMVVMLDRSGHWAKYIAMIWIGMMTMYKIAS